MPVVSMFRISVFVVLILGMLMIGNNTAAVGDGLYLISLAYLSSAAGCGYPNPPGFFFVGGGVWIASCRRPPPEFLRQYIAG